MSNMWGKHPFQGDTAKLAVCQRLDSKEAWELFVLLGTEFNKRLKAAAQILSTMAASALVNSPGWVFEKAPVGSFSKHQTEKRIARQNKSLSEPACLNSFHRPLRYFKSQLNVLDYLSDTVSLKHESELPMRPLSDHRVSWCKISFDIE